MGVTEHGSGASVDVVREVRSRVLLRNFSWVSQSVLYLVSVTAYVNKAHGCVDQNCRQLTETAAVHSPCDQYGRTPQNGKRRRFMKTAIIIAVTKFQVFTYIGVARVVNVGIHSRWVHG